MRVEKISTKQIKFAPYNPRKMRSDEFRKLVTSIQTYNCYEPLIVNSQTWHVVGGNQRLRALIELGYKEVDVVTVDLSSTDERLLNVALNRIQGEFDFDKLPVLIEELSKISDIDLGLSGFDSSEIDKLLEGIREPKDPDDFDFKATVESIEKPITQKGDLIELGSHRLYCGDSANPEDLKLLMNNKRSAMLFCDPPYGISYYQGDRPSMSYRPKQCREWKTIYQDDLSEEEYQKWLEKVLINMDSFLAQGAPGYIFNSHKQFFGMYGILRKLKYHIGTVIIWAKPNFNISFGDYNPQVEFCAYFWKEDNGAHKWYGPTNETTLWEIKRDPNKSYQHLTQKPVAIPARAIANSSQRGDVVLELFGGSGSTLIAAESLGRKCFCMEIDPVYCTGIVKRYIAYVGKDKVAPELVQKYMKENPDGR